MACDGAAHWSLAGAEEEEKRGFGVSFSIRVDLSVQPLVGRGRNAGSRSVLPRLPKILVSGRSGRQSSVRETSCSAIILRRLINA